MSDKLNTRFPKTFKTFAKTSEVRPKDELVIPNLDLLSKALDEDVRPKKVQFLMEVKASNLVKDCKSWECSWKDFLKRNKISVHIDKGNIFLDNKSSGECIYDIFSAQQDYIKKLLNLKFSFSADYEAYVLEYLMAIKSTNSSKYNMWTNKMWDLV